MTVPFVSYFAPLFLLFASGVSALEGAREKLRTAWVFLATAVLMYGFTYTGMYLTSTPVSLPEINGVQTRYLLGALFALFALASMLMGRTMALQNLRPGLPQKTPPAWRVLHYGFASRSSARCCCSRRITSGRDAVRRLRIALKEDPAFDRFC